MSKNESKELIEAEIVKDNDGAKARKKAKEIRHFNDFFVPIIIDFVLFIFGFCLLIWAEKVTDIISIAIGALFILYALYNFIDYYRSKPEDRHIINLVTGIAMVIAGAFLCVKTGFIKEAISYVVGVFIIIVSIVKLQDALKLRKWGGDYLLSLLMAIIGLAAGALLVLFKIFIIDILMQVIGAFIVIFAVSNIIGHISLTRAKKK